MCVIDIQMGRNSQQCVYNIFLHILNSRNSQWWYMTVLIYDYIFTKLSSLVKLVKLSSLEKFCLCSVLFISWSQVWWLYKFITIFSKVSSSHTESLHKDKYSLINYTYTTAKFKVWLYPSMQLLVNLKIPSYIPSDLLVNNSCLDFFLKWLHECQLHIIVNSRYLSW